MLAYAQAFRVLSGSGSLYCQAGKLPDAIDLQTIIARSDDPCVNTPMSTPMSTPIRTPCRFIAIDIGHVQGIELGQIQASEIRGYGQEKYKTRPFFF